MKEEATEAYGQTVIEGKTWKNSEKIDIREGHERYLSYFEPGRRIQQSERPCDKGMNHSISRPSTHRTNEVRAMARVGGLHEKWSGDDSSQESTLTRGESLSRTHWPEMALAGMDHELIVRFLVHIIRWSMGRELLEQGGSKQVPGLYGIRSTDVSATPP